MKLYTPEEMATVLSDHKRWRETFGNEGSRADLRDADLRDADLRGADLRDAYLRGADLRGADLRDAYLRDADLSRADLSRADLRGADLIGLKISAIRTFSGLYEYQCMAVISIDGIPWIRMGCLWKSLDDWDVIGICKSNVGEFPDDGSEKCERRVRAFNYVKAEALAMAEKFKSEKAAA